ncbi:hypothetical protein EJ110_NYTH39063 [Nymphaea thermarum]|nr:hypothetical protein EJ110_NYTH39063 [Nymphaea thermarum]
MAISHARDRSLYVHPVLNPVENASQWKALKTREARNKPILGRKENIPCEQEALISFSSDTKQEMRVDTSLSNWLSPINTIAENFKDDNLYSSNIGKSRMVFGPLTDGNINRMPPQESEYQSPGGNRSKSSASEEFSEKFSSGIKGIPNTTRSKSDLAFNPIPELFRHQTT